MIPDPAAAERIQFRRESGTVKAPDAPPSAALGVVAAIVTVGSVTIVVLAVAVLPSEKSAVTVKPDPGTNICP